MKIYHSNVPAIYIIKGHNSRIKQQLSDWQHILLIKSPVNKLVWYLKRHYSWKFTIWDEDICHSNAPAIYAPHQGHITYKTTSFRLTICPQNFKVYTKSGNFL